MLSGFVNAGYFLFSLSVSLLIFVLWLRVALQYFKVSALSPIGQIISKLTNPLLQPFEQLNLPCFSRLKAWDIRSLLLIGAIEVTKYTLISWLVLPMQLSWAAIVALVLVDMVIQPCNIAFAAIILRVVMSWVNPHWQHPLADLAFILSDPLFVQIRRFVPIVAGIDFSPLISLILLKTMTLFVGAYVPLGLTG